MPLAAKLKLQLQAPAPAPVPAAAAALPRDKAGAHAHRQATNRRPIVPAPAGWSSSAQCGEITSIRDNRNIAATAAAVTTSMGSTGDYGESEEYGMMEW